jgi:hypothetical protein
MNEKIFKFFFHNIPILVLAALEKQLLFHSFFHCQLCLKGEINSKANDKIIFIVEKVNSAIFNFTCLLF